MSSISHNVLLISDALDAKAVCDDLIGSNDGLFKVDWVRSCADGLERLAAAAGPRAVAVLIDLFLPDSSGLDTFAQVLRAAPQIPILILTDARHEAVARLAVRQGAHDYFLNDRLESLLLPKALRSIIERADRAAALYEEQDRARVTLDSIGDAVISTDLQTRVTFLNAVAERMTGWTRQEAVGRPVEEVFEAVDGATGEQVRKATEMAMHDATPVGLTPTYSTAHGGALEAPFEDSAAPIYGRQGEVVGSVVVFRDMGTARALSNRMFYLAQHDSLTDLPNRVLLNDRLNHAICLAHRRRKKMAVLFLDVDRFKHVNDSLGHEIGDRLLQSVAQRLLNCVRRSDTVSRQGGDEFVILLSEITQAQDAAVSAEKMLQALAAPHRIDQHELRVTDSIGIVVYPDDGTEADVLLKHADFAMYHAKDQGRNNYQFFEPDLNVRALERQVLESGLRRAIDSQELVLHYQPKIDLLAESGLARCDLEIELREAVLMQDAQFALEVLSCLKELHVQLALDDFGTGYSSLSHLKQFPIDILKIDQSFVRELTTDSDAGSIVGAVIGMGKNLGMQVVAEGVESREQLTCLQQLLCPQGQGYYLSEPLTAAELTRLLRRKEAETASAATSVV